MNKIFLIEREGQGLLACVSGVLGCENINIESIDFHTFDGMAACVIAVDKYDFALNLLAAASITAIPEENLVIKLDDVPGALSNVAKKFKDADIQIRRLYIIMRDDKHSIVGISSERMDEARNLVTDELIFPI